MIAGKPVDMWALGVIIYIILSGSPPFSGVDQADLNYKILNGIFDFPDSAWSHISDEAIDMIRGLLTVNPHVRLTVEQALTHPWMREELDAELDAHDLAACLENLRIFNAARKLKGSIKAVMAANKIRNLLNFRLHNAMLAGVPATLEARYDVANELLGEGGYSRVLKGKSRVDSRDVAVKQVTRAQLNANGERLLRREVQILQSLTHPNILRVHDFFDNDARYYYLVLEYVDGGELFDRIVKKSSFTEKEARYLVYTILSTLKYLHDKNIVHR